MLFLLNLHVFILSTQIYAKEYIFSPVAVSTGKILYNSENPFENQLYLGSALGIFNRPGFSSGYNRLEQVNEFWGNLVLPRSEGVFGVTFVHSEHESLKSLSHGLLRAAFGKKLTENLLFGFSLNFSYQDSADLKTLIAFEPSFIYTINPHSVAENWLAIHNFFVYSALQNLNFYDSAKAGLNPSLHLGFGARFIKIRDFTAAVQTEGSIDTRLSLFPYSFALNLGYSIFQFRAAFNREIAMDGAASGAGKFSLGAGFLYAWPGFTLSAQYAIQGFETKSLQHYISVGALFNFADTLAPALKVTPNYEQFSPNADGIQDFISFHIRISELSPIKHWKLAIKNARGEIVRNFEKDSRTRSIDFPMYRMISDLFRQREYQYVPEYIIWDGTSDRLNTTASSTANPPGIKLPEGTYFYEMTATDIHDMTSDTARGTIVIDTTIGDVNLKRSIRNDDYNNKIFLSVSQYVSAQSEDYFTGTIFNDLNTPVRTYTWKGAVNLPKQFIWDGVDQKGLSVKAGIYHYEFKSHDLAGNQSISKIPHIYVNYDINYADIIPESDGFSPNNDNVLDNLNLQLFAANLNNIASWSLYLTREVIREKQRPDNVISWAGDKNNILLPVSWDGKNQKGILVQDGQYYLTLIVRNINNEIIQSQPIRISVDTRPPDVSIQPDLFKITPDGDGIEDKNFFHIQFLDQSLLKNYTLNLYEVLNINGKKTRNPFKTWTSQNSLPDLIYFEGVSDTGLIMESLKDYEYELEVTDIYNNSLKKTSTLIRSGVLVIPSQPYLKITLTGLTYGASLSIESFDALNQVFNLLKYDYPGYRVRIESHTHSHDKEEINIQLSEQRARSIMNFFANKGMSLKNIAYQGFGEIMPLTEIESEINDYKNDRIEFILLK